MKMKRNNKTDARPGEKGARSFRRSCRMVALSVLAAVVVALFGAAPAFADTTTSGPAIDKTVKELQDAAGNVYGGRISLSVTGSASSTTTKTKANVIFVVDVSRSMNDDYSLAKDDGGAYSKDDKDLAYFCQSKWGGRSGYVTIRNYNDNSDYYDYYYTVYKSVIYELTLYADGTIADATKYTGDRYKHVAQSQTRLAAAQSAIRTAANSIIGQGNAKVSLVKFSDTASVVVNPTDNLDYFNSNVNSLTATGGTNWEAGLVAASSDKLISSDANTKNYVIFVSDGNPTFRNSANGYTNDKNGSIYGTGISDPNGRNFSAADAVAKSLIKSGVTLYKINAFGDADNMQNLGSVGVDHYFNASDSASLQNALSKIVQDIVNAHSYRNVRMTDTLSDAVVAKTTNGDLDPNSITVTVKDKDDKTVAPTKNDDGTYSYTKDGKLWSFNGPTVSGKTVNWNLGETYQLEDGWTYTASFDVKLTQDTLNKAAEILNGTPESFPLTKEYGVVKAYTNTWSGNGVSYMEQTTVNNEMTEKPGQEEFDRPSIPVPTATALTVSKKVSGGAANTSEKFNFVLSNKDLARKTYGTGDAAIAFNAEGNCEFKLAHGESKSVVGLPVGIPLSLKETGLSGNAKTSTTAKVDEKETKTVKSESSDAKETDPVEVEVTARPYTLTDGKLVAPKDANTVEFTNTAELVPQTGVSVDPRPMVVLLGVAVAGGVAVVAGVRKRHGREE